MDDAGRVRGAEPFGRADPHVRDLGRLEGPAVDPRIDPFPLEQLHREPQPAVASFAEASDRNDVRVRERCGGLRLASESPPCRL